MYFTGQSRLCLLLSTNRSTCSMSAITATQQVWNPANKPLFAVKSSHFVVNQCKQEHDVAFYSGNMAAHIWCDSTHRLENKVKERNPSEVSGLKNNMLVFSWWSWAWPFEMMFETGAGITLCVTYFCYYCVLNKCFCLFCLFVQGAWGEAWCSLQHDAAVLFRSGRSLCRSKGNAYIALRWTHPWLV